MDFGPSEDACLLDGPRYDFDNQLTYLYREPVLIPGGSTVTLRCNWNNSRSNPDLILDPPQDITYGERTDQEMCFGFTYVSFGPVRD